MDFVKEIDCRGMPRACPRERAFALEPRCFIRGSQCTQTCMATAGRGHARACPYRTQSDKNKPIVIYAHPASTCTHSHSTLKYFYALQVLAEHVSILCFVNWRLFSYVWASFRSAAGRAHRADAARICRAAAAGFPIRNFSISPVR